MKKPIVQTSKQTAKTPLPALSPSDGERERRAPLQDLAPDPKQPRQSFPPDPEFEKSTAENGILEPLIVRSPQPWDAPTDAPWIIVDGGRRYERAQKLKLADVPIRVREFTDEAELRRYQRIMGTQRLNLHGLEVAASLQKELELRRQTDPKFSKDDLGNAVGMERSTVYEYLSLLALPKDIEKAYRAGEVNHSQATRIAAVPSPAGQAELLEDIRIWPERYGEVMSVTDLEKRIAEKHCLSLKGAPFKPDKVYEIALSQHAVALQGKAHFAPAADGALPMALAPCQQCPHRSGNLPNFPKAKNQDLCTQPECFRAKAFAAAARRGEATLAPEAYAKAKGQYVTEKRGGYENWGSLGYCGPDKVREKLGKACPAPVTTVDAEGQIVKVWKRSELKAALEKKGVTFSDSAKARQSEAEQAEAEKRRKETGERREALCQEQLPQLAAGLGKLNDARAWKLMNALTDEHHSTWIRLKLKVGKSDREQVLARVFSASHPVDYDGQWRKADCAAWAAAGVDLPKLEAAALKQQQQKETEKTESKNKNKKGKP